MVFGASTRIAARRSWRWVSEVWVAPTAPRALALAGALAVGLPVWTGIAQVVPFAIGYTLLAAVTCLLLALLAGAFAAWTWPGSKARVRRIALLALVLLPLASLGGEVDRRWWNSVAFYASLIDVALLAAGLATSALAGLGGLAVGLVDRRRANQGQPGVEDTIALHFKAATPAVRASAVVGCVALIWLATSWMYGLGEPRGSDLPWLSFVEPAVGFIDGLARPATLTLAVAALAMYFVNPEDLEAARAKQAADVLGATTSDDTEPTHE